MSSNDGEQMGQISHFPAFGGQNDSTTFEKKDIQSEICTMQLFVHLEPKVRMAIKYLKSKYLKEWNHLAAINDKVVMLRKTIDGTQRPKFEKVFYERKIQKLME